MVEKVGSTIYKPGVYNTPGIYNGRAYKSKTVYKESNGGDITEVVIGGKTYPVVKIGNLFWLAENLKYIPNGITLTNNVNTNPSAYYFQDDPSLGDEIFYNAYSSTYFENNKLNLFPSGWRVPKKEDFENLSLYLQANNLSTLDLRLEDPIWNGTNKLKFNAAPYGGGSGTLANPIIINWSRGNAIFWTSTISNNHDVFGDWQYYRSFIRNDDNDLHIDDTLATYMFSIRLVKDV